MMWWVVFQKEVTDSLRDHRSVATALLYALMGPLLLVPVLGFASQSIGHGAASVITIPAEGADRAPGLVEFLRQKNIELSPAPPDPEKAVRDLVVDMVLVIPPEYADDFRAGRPATVHIVMDRSRSFGEGQGQSRRLNGVLELYSKSVGALRLVARGVSPRVVSALSIAIDDVATPEGTGAQLLGMVPIFLMTSLFFGGVYIAVDVTAGERERGSLEPLMAAPVTATQIVVGKLGVVMFFAFATMVITLAAFTLVVNLPLPFHEIPGMRFRLSLQGAFQIFVALTPLVLPVAAMQMVVANRSKTVKEAFTAASLCTIIPLMPGLFLVFAPWKSSATAMAVPVFGQDLLMAQVLRASSLPFVDYLVAGSTATALGVVLAGVAVATCAHARLLSDG